MKILTAAQMRAIDRSTAQDYALPDRLLMENAGFGLYLSLLDFFPNDLKSHPVAVLCGKGNNGGDGLVLARILAQHGHAPSVYLFGRREDMRGSAGENLEAYTRSGGVVHQIETDSRRVRLDWDRYGIFVDALLGTGMERPLQGAYAGAAEEINRRDAFCLAVDIPTGMASDSMEAPELCIRADATVTFTAPKIAHVLNPDRESLGEIRVVPIGSPDVLLDSDHLWLSVMDRDRVAAAVPSRPTDSHKGTFGHVAVVAGSQDKSGAARLVSWAALKTGAGLVTACVPEQVQSLVATSHPELMTLGLPAQANGELSSQAQEAVEATLDGKSALVLGPGLGTSAQTEALVRDLVAGLSLPIILDADGINSFESHREALRRDPDRPLILTPHPREFSRISGLSTSEIRADRCNLARSFALENRVWLVLKDFRTLIADPEGRVQVCPLGNPGMAKAGSGDVLAGVIGALVGISQAQGKHSRPDIGDAVMTAVYLHSKAGDVAARDGLHSVTASAIIESLGAAFQLLEETTE